MNNLRKSISYILNSILSFGFIGGIRYSFYFFLSHFIGKNDGKSKRMVTVPYYYPNRMTYKSSGGIVHQLFYRPNTSDVPLIANILIGIKEYDIELDSKKFDNILDLGANIGLFSLLYSNKYPDKKYLAVEPERENYIILKNNLRKIENMNTERLAVWYRFAWLNIKDNGNNWGFTVEEINENERNDECIKGVDIDSLCQKYNLKGNLLVKMDIEGSEIPIFQHLDNQKWLNRTYALIIEIHDKKGGKDYINICEAMKERGYSKTCKGENVVFIRK